MPNFSKYETVDVDIDISVEEFFSEMDDTEKLDMRRLLYKDMDIVSSIEKLDELDEEDKCKFYKEFAYHVGVSDTNHLEYLINELKYWKR